MNLGRLFPEYFLREGIRGEDAYRAIDQLAVLRSRLMKIFAKFPTAGSPNESQTENDLIFPVLDVLGWGPDRRLTQQRAARRGRADVPDLLLFASPEAKTAANAQSAEADRFRHGVVVAESKRWNRPLDRAGGSARGSDDREVPSSQMLRYLSRAETLSDKRIQWGILTNGRLWRLYWQAAKSRSEEYLEIDLAAVLGITADLLAPPDSELDHWLTVFLLLFGRPAFTIEIEAGRTFALVALDQGRRFEEELTSRLDDVVFGTVFERLAQGIHAASQSQSAAEVDLGEVKHATLTLLYRLLFVLYAEDRDLLPVADPRYADYGLSPLRDEIEDHIARKDVLSTRFARYWAQLRGLFRAIAKGDRDLGLPPYNGGLFSSDAVPLLERVELSDATLAPIILHLSHRRLDEGWRRINYRDLSVQQLGSIYERLLENELEIGPDGAITVRKDQSGRKRTGSFYTPEELVRLILVRTLQPLLDEISDAFEARSGALASDRRPKADRLPDLQPLDPASRFLDLKICDPAMGSGHFLVSAVDYLADRVLEAMAAARHAVPFADASSPYESPLAGRIAAIRARILSLAERGGWKVDETQLDDRRLVRRMILKRVIHGVDKNPMAVELAKVALWLHTFTVGAPLSFLDHHLRCGDSLLGGWAGDLREILTHRGGLLAGTTIAGIERASAGMGEVEALTDSDISEVEHSREAYDAVAETTAPLEALMSLVQAEHLMGVLDAAPSRRPKRVTDLLKAGASPRAIEKAIRDNTAFDRAGAWQDVLDGTFGDPARIATGEIEIAAPELREQLSLLPETPPAQSALFDEGPPDARRRVLAHVLVDEARGISARHRFLHWQLAFPNVWKDWLSAEPRGGFDAVIGNPPYVRQEKLAEIKPALRKAYAAWDGMADLYVYFYELGLRLLRPGGRLSYVVTNKWLKAGYAETLRGLLADRAWLDLVVDFGHAKQFFKDADVFPCIVVAERPDGSEPPEQTSTCLIPREEVRPADLVKQVGSCRSRCRGWASPSRPGCWSPRRSRHS